jgi:hypothetical protein
VSSGQLAKNPRVIKRFVNVFRFYAIIRQEQKRAGESSSEMILDQIARVAVLVIRWPQLRNLLVRQVGADKDETVLALLERSIRSLPREAKWDVCKTALDDQLKTSDPF